MLKKLKYFGNISDIISHIYVRTFYYWFPLIIGTSFFRIKCMLFGLKIGKNVKCFGGINILRSSKSTISFGNNVSIVSYSPRCTASSIYAPTKLQTHSPSASIIIDDDVGLNGTSITARSKIIHIGKGTMIGPNVTIMDSDFHALWPPEKRICNPAIENDEDVIIGQNIWIALGCTILKGVTIGDNSVIAAGSVVVSNIPCNVLAGGIPAKTIRYIDTEKLDEKSVTSRF